MRFGLDYVSAPTVAQLKAAGATFVGRYLSTPGNPKNATASEIAQLHKAGIDVVLVFETVADRALGGAANGKADAAAALEQARTLGAPDAQPLYFAVDFDASPGQQRQIAAYFRAVGKVLGLNRVGCYGGYYVVKRLFDAKLISYGWQTIAWSGGQWDPRAQLRQTDVDKSVGGHGVDFNHAATAAFGQWTPPAKPKPKPRPKPKPKPAPAPQPVTVVITGPKGGLIARRPLTALPRLVSGLVRRFGRIGIRKGR